MSADGGASEHSTETDLADSEAPGVSGVEDDVTLLQPPAAVDATFTSHPLAFGLVCTLFLMWAVALNLNDILVPHLKKACALSDLQSSLIQAAYFGGYFLAALPAGHVVQRLGYRCGMLVGLTACSTGALLFVPAAALRAYGVFLFALFVLACGACQLEVAANPYVTLLGAPETATQRLNFAATMNAIGAVLTPQLGKYLILTGIEYTAEDIARMPVGEVEAWRAAEARTVQAPYTGLAGLFLLLALALARIKLPDCSAASLVERSTKRVTPRAGRVPLNLLFAVVAQFLYVGAQVGVGSFLIRFVQEAVPGTSERQAADFLFLHLLCFLCGRATGTALLKKLNSSLLLFGFACTALGGGLLAVLGTRYYAVAGIVLLGGSHSIMFPTIFSLGLMGLDPRWTKRGSALLVMAIIGGGCVTTGMGVVSDHSNIRAAFSLPIGCHLGILAYAFGHRIWRRTAS